MKYTRTNNIMLQQPAPVASYAGIICTIDLVKTGHRQRPGVLGVNSGWTGNVALFEIANVTCSKRYRRRSRDGS